jgi:hypothetical protein
MDIPGFVWLIIVLVAGWIGVNLLERKATKKMIRDIEEKRKEKEDEAREKYEAQSPSEFVNGLPTRDDIDAVKRNSDGKIRGYLKDLLDRKRMGGPGTKDSG